jgi:cyclophilin family peptidyl-prolyl cis-trans isomerase/protein-disulfide isomerase
MNAFKNCVVLKMDRLNTIQIHAGKLIQGLICVLILLMSISLSACSTSETASPSPIPTDTGIPLDLGPAPTDTPPLPTSTPLPPAPTLVPIPTISDSDWTRGPLDAAVTLLIYSDFQCPYCAKLSPILRELESLHPDDLRIVYRHFPIKLVHDKAGLAGEAAEAAGSQGHFWEMHDLLFERQQEWSNLSSSDFIGWLRSVSSELDLDTAQFMQDIESGRYMALLDEYFQTGMSYGLIGTPTIFINGKYLQLEPTLTLLEASIRLELLEPQRQSNYPAFTLSDGGTYLAYLELDTGQVVIQLYPESAPNAVNSFIYLAQSGWYNDNPIFQVVPGKFVESGDPSGTGFGDQGYHYDIETDPTLKFDKPGMVAMSSSGPNTNGSRFFISLSALPELDGTRTIFGRVIEGLDLLTQLEMRDPLEDLMTPPEATIHKITIEEQ